MPEEGKETKTPAITSPSLPDFTSVIQSKSLDLETKRKKVLEGLGLRHPRKKYASPDERKAAAKKRREERKAERAKVLGKYGIAPKKKGPRLTKAQRKTRRSKRGKERREFLREQAKQHPELAKKYGIDVSRFKL